MSTGRIPSKPTGTKPACKLLACHNLWQRKYTHTDSILNGHTVSRTSEVTLPLTFCATARRVPDACPEFHVQSLKSATLVAIPCSQTLALIEGIRVAPLSACILVAHCVRTTTAALRVAASFCKAPTMYWSTCIRRDEGDGPIGFPF